eukprot:scaffold2425_cov76-Skeletonema_dohrnii-CCMP3373.AAC.11
MVSTHSFMIQEERSVSVFDEVLLIAAAVAHSVQWLFADEANCDECNRGAKISELSRARFLTYIAMYYHI